MASHRSTCTSTTSRSARSGSPGPHGHRGGHRQLRRLQRRLQPDPHGPRVRQDDAVPPADRPRVRACSAIGSGLGVISPADADHRVAARSATGTSREPVFAGDTIHVRHAGWWKAAARPRQARRDRLVPARHQPGRQGRPGGRVVTLVECRPRREAATAGRAPQRDCRSRPRSTAPTGALSATASLLTITGLIATRIRHGRVPPLRPGQRPGGHPRSN